MRLRLQQPLQIPAYQEVSQLGHSGPTYTVVCETLSERSYGPQTSYEPDTRFFCYVTEILRKLPHKLYFMTRPRYDVDFPQIFLLKIHSLVQKREITLEILVADRTLAHLQLDFRVVIHVVNAHFVRDAEAAECDVVPVHRIVMARGYQSVSLRANTNK